MEEKRMLEEEGRKNFILGQQARDGAGEDLSVRVGRSGGGV